MDFGQDDERDIVDYGTDKRKGETYSESYTRKQGELQDKADAEAKAQQNQNDLQSRPMPTGKPTTEEGYRRSSPARTAIMIGWGLMVVSGLCLVSDATYSPIAGYTITILTAVAGGVFLAVGYFAEKVISVIGIGVCWLVYSSGKTPDGFQYGAVPIKVWFIVVAFAVVGYAFGSIFARK